MYTEYVFDNKKYEVASREIKATLFDIVSSEEERIAQLREKAFIDATDPRRAAELQNLYVQQDSCLREILSISEQLTKSLQRVDACSRKLKQIEDKNIAQIIANIKGIEEPQTAMVNPLQPIMMNQPSDALGMNYSGAADVAMAPEPMDEPVVDSSLNNQPVEVIHDVMDVPVAEAPKEEIIHEVMDIPEVAETPAVEEPKEEIIHEVMDIPESGTSEESQITNDSIINIPVVTQPETTAVEEAPVIVEETPVITEETPVVTETAPVITEEAPVITEEVPVVTEEAPVITEETPVIAEDTPVIPEGTPVIAEETPVIPEGTPVIAEDTPAPTEGTPVIAEEGTTEPLIVPSTDVIPVEEPVAETTSAPLIVPDTPAEPAIEELTTSAPLIVPETESTPVEGEESTVSETESEPKTIPVITISSDGPLEAVTGSALDDSQTNAVIPEEGGIPEMVPEVSETASTSPVSEPLVFNKRTADPPKVIMISGKQAAKLRQSLPTQEALLSAKGFFKNESGLEQQLVDNGLLEPDVASKQAQIEQMMNQANELYAAGKVEEAQNMYNQISELNQALQLESAGSVK
ncbi:MAG: hypothetical protein IKF71_04230 [Bacilli bacterium]|nr:hypothetical protein [Bacilli bacterium]